MCDVFQFRACAGLEEIESYRRYSYNTHVRSALLCYSVVDQFAPAVSLCLHGAIRADGMDEFRQERTRCLVRSTSAAGEGLGGPKGAHMRSPHRMNRLALDGLLWMA